MTRLACLLVLAAFSGCQCQEDLSLLPGKISGRACDPDTGRGLSGAAIEVKAGGTKRNTLANSLGEYQLSSLPPGTYTVTARLDDVERVFEDIKLESRGNEQQEDTACRGQPSDPDGGTLAGQVCNRHTGELIRDGQVTILLANGEQMLGATDPEDGTFEIPGVPEGTHVAQIQGDGFQRSFRIVIEKDETTTLDLAEDCESVSFSEGSVAGSFCDDTEDEGNLVGAHVEVEPQGGGEIIEDTTDTAGAFFVGSLAPGIYDVRVTHANRSFDELGVEVVAGETTTIADPRPECADRAEVGRIAGQICDVEAGGVFVGDVDLIPGADTDGEDSQSVTSDSEGRFAFEDLNVGTYTIIAHKDGYERTYTSVVVVPFQTTVVTDTTQDGACPSPGDECVDFQTDPLQAQDGRILVVLDRSGSMQLAFAGGGANTKWSAAKNALETVTTALDGSVEFGLMMYPDATSNQVPGACNENRNLEVAVGPSHADDVVQRLDATTPVGGTPTAVVLSAARTVLAPLVGDDRPLAVLLVTDGAPNCNLSFNDSSSCRCTSDQDKNDDGVCHGFNCLDDSNTVSQIAAIRDLGVTTYVLGISGFENFEDVLNNMATVGGAPLPGATKYYEANDEAALQQSLDAITQEVLSCSVQAPSDVSLSSFASIEVTVGSQVLSRDPAQLNGWDVTGSRTITLFGAACDTAVAGQQGINVHACE